MKFFYIDDTYITMLLQHDASVQQNHGTRPYIGVVLNINDIDYFAPLASPKDKYERSDSIIYFKVFSHRTPPKLLGVIKLNCMIPVPKQYLKSVLIDTNTPYGLLLASQHRYIKSKQDAIKKEANTLHHLVVAKKETHLVNMCCNYVLLEEKMTEHMQVLADAKTAKAVLGSTS
jgi:protein AbiQ